jgi:hypothetical protein
LLLTDATPAAGAGATLRVPPTARGAPLPAGAAWPFDALSECAAR